MLDDPSRGEHGLARSKGANPSLCYARVLVRPDQVLELGERADQALELRIAGPGRELDRVARPLGLDPERVQLVVRRVRAELPVARDEPAVLLLCELAEPYIRIGNGQAGFGTTLSGFKATVLAGVGDTATYSTGKSSAGLEERLLVTHKGTVSLSISALYAGTLEPPASVQTQLTSIAKTIFTKLHA